MSAFPIPRTFVSESELSIFTAVIVFFAAPSLSSANPVSGAKNLGSSELGTIVVFVGCDVSDFFAESSVSFCSLASREDSLCSFELSSDEQPIDPVIAAPRQIRN